MAVSTDALIANHQVCRLIVLPVTAGAAFTGEHRRVMHIEIGVFPGIAVTGEARVITHHDKWRGVAGLTIFGHTRRPVGGSQGATGPEAVVRQRRIAQRTRQFRLEQPGNWYQQKYQQHQ